MVKGLKGIGGKQLPSGASPLRVFLRIFAQACLPSISSPRSACSAPNRISLRSSASRLVPRVRVPYLDANLGSALPHFHF